MKKNYICPNCHTAQTLGKKLRGRWVCPNCHEATLPYRLSDYSKKIEELKNQPKKKPFKKYYNNSYKRPFQAKGTAVNE